MEQSFFLGPCSLECKLYLLCNCTAQLYEILFPVISLLPNHWLLQMDSSPTLLFSYLLSCCSIFFILSFCSFAFQVLCSLEMLVFVKSVPLLLFKRSLLSFVHCVKWCWNRLFCEENYVILKHWWDNSSANRDAFFYSLGIRFTIFPVFLAVTVCLLFSPHFLWNFLTTDFLFCHHSCLFTSL